MGGGRCTFRGCEKISGPSNAKLSFFHYPHPHKTTEKFDKWVKMANSEHIRDLAVSQIINRVVCADHFRDECFMNYKKNKLTKKAVPTLKRLPNGLVLDYASGENPKPIRLPPTTLKHMISPFNEESESAAESVSENFSEFSEEVLDSIVSDNQEIYNISIKTDEPLTKKFKTILKDPNSEQTDSELEEILITRIVPGIPGPSSAVTERLVSCESLISENVENRNIELEDEIINIIEDEIFYTQKELNSRIRDVEVIYSEKINKLKEKYKSEFQKERQVHALAKSNSDTVIKELKEKLSEEENKNLLTETNTHILEKKIQEQCNEIDSLKKLLTKKENIESQKISTQVNLVSSSNNLLSKPQLFNAVKKYLSPSMSTLIRMEMFGGSERPWKPDEKNCSVELLNLGANVYNYLCDEWRFRLPPRIEVEKWKEENLSTIDDDDL